MVLGVEGRGGGGAVGAEAEAWSWRGGGAVGGWWLVGQPELRSMGSYKCYGV